METPSARDRFPELDERVSPEDYNFDHFRAKYLLRDGKRTLTNRGIMPGEIAPDFVLREATGEPVRLSSLRGKPVILHFGSYT
jgi:hypothetical protein